MALILNIETSSPVCSVCVAKNGSAIDFRENTEQNSHARLLTLMIDDLLAANKISFQELDAIAVSAGPGSYTGLRIGVSATKGLCYALNKPLISVPTLAALSEGIKQKVNEDDVFFMPVMDARRMDVYTAFYDTRGKEIFETACVTLNDELEKKISSLGKIFIGGNAMNKCKSVFTSPEIYFIENVDNDSKSMITISEKKFLENKFEDLAYFEPIYLNEFLPKKKSV